MGFAEPRPYLRHKNINPTAYLTRAMPERLLLGEVLFKSPYILGPRLAAQGISCHSCHPNGAATDRLKFTGQDGPAGVVDLTHRSINPQNDNGRDDALRIPSLRGVRYLAPYGHDGRMASLRDFTREVQAHTLGGEPLGEAELDALVAYMLEFDFLPNPNLTPTGAVAAEAGADEKQGEKIFHASGCVSCHIPEAYFTDGKVRRLSGKKTLSPFSMENAVKTPTLLRARRERYLHNGAAGFDDAITGHAAQTGVKLSSAEIRLLKKYLELLMSEEKPVDNRHISERAAEMHTWLKLIQQKTSVQRKTIVLKTLAHHFLRLKAEVTTARDREFVKDYLHGVERVLSGKMNVDDFNLQVAPGLRFLGTKL